MSLCTRPARVPVPFRGVPMRKSFVVSLFALVIACLPASPARAALAQRDVAVSAPRVAGEILVRFKTNLTADMIARVNALHGGIVKQEIPELELQRVQVPVGQEDAAIAAYDSDPNVL